MIILIGGEKGGTGKSTLATNLAVWLASSEHDVCLVDTDIQGTSTSWADRRTDAQLSPEIHVIQRTGKLVRPLQKLFDIHEFVIVDAGGRDSQELRSTLMVAHAAIIPIQASIADLETVSSMSGILDGAKILNEDLNAFFVISRAPTNPKLKTDKGAREYIADAAPDIPVIKASVCERQVYRDALIAGSSVIEERNKKAIAEINKVFKEMFHG